MVEIQQENEVISKELLMICQMLGSKFRHFENQILKKNLNTIGLRDIKDTFHEKKVELLFSTEVGTIGLELKLLCDFVQKKNITGLCLM